MLEWLIRYHPATAAHIIPEITGEAERRLGVPREQTERMLRGQRNWKLDADTRREFYAGSSPLPARKPDHVHSPAAVTQRSSARYRH